MVDHGIYSYCCSMVVVVVSSTMQSVSLLLFGHKREDIGSSSNKLPRVLLYWCTVVPPPTRQKTPGSGIRLERAVRLCRLRVPILRRIATQQRSITAVAACYCTYGSMNINSIVYARAAAAALIVLFCYGMLIAVIAARRAPQPFSAPRMFRRTTQNCFFGGRVSV